MLALGRLKRTRKLLSLWLTLMLLTVLPVLAKDNEAKIKAAVEDRYQQWLASRKQERR